MKKVSMRLHESPFRGILSGEKKMECRLNDEKRQGLEVGDVIEFSLRPDFIEKFEKTIVGLHTFDSFEDLFNKFPEEDTNGNMYQYYSKEDEEKYGVLAIELR